MHCPLGGVSSRPLRRAEPNEHSAWVSPAFEDPTMKESVIIIGGGVAGLSAAAYASASGFDTTLVEHAPALGGVCTAWQRGPYQIDGCIHWLTGGPFAKLYEELGITDSVRLEPIQKLATITDHATNAHVELNADLDALEHSLALLAPADLEEIGRMFAAARALTELQPPLHTAPDLMRPWDGLRALWEMKSELGTMLHYQQPLAQFVAEHLQTESLRRVLTAFVPGEAPVLFLLMVLGYLSRGWLSRPAGGTAAFRDALIDGVRQLGVSIHTSATVDEILISDGRAAGVRLADGTCFKSDAVICTSSTPELIFRLLGGRYHAAATDERLASWTLFPPIVLASYGIASPLAHMPQILVLRGVEPIDVGGVSNDKLYLRICNDDRSYAPPGHAVVQAMLTTSYDWWAERHGSYEAEKAYLARRVLLAIERYLPGVERACQLWDVATPLTFWRSARSWRGAYEGWLPSGRAMLSGSHPHRLRGLSGLYVAGQWVEPGGGIPMACSSGRMAAQVLCADKGHPFSVPSELNRARSHARG
jgi:phytoene dehydrogenase-like protein